LAKKDQRKNLYGLSLAPPDVLGLYVSLGWLSTQIRENTPYLGEWRVNKMKKDRKISARPVRVWAKHPATRFMIPRKPWGGGFAPTRLDAIMQGGFV
jgi:hypothetical protein